ncbi:hypothetical protein N7507_000552 [Penicillium longicatenatum]|nr:hypothetical protein N7507_000552 [Penicillium longicatenatum]
MSQDVREETPELIPNDGSDHTDSEVDSPTEIEVSSPTVFVVDSPDAFDYMIGGVSNREVEELTNRGNERVLRAYYQRLVDVASVLNVELPPEEPVTPNRFLALPETAVDQQIIDLEVECAICLSPPEIGKRITTLPCGHLFHYLCIERWLTRCPTCPLCRKEVFPSDQRGSTTGNGNSPHRPDRRPERHVHWAI